MRRATIPAAVGLVSAAAGAAVPKSGDPPPESSMTEAVEVSDLFVNREVNGTVNGVSFMISGRNATNLLCQKTKPGLPSEVITCGDSKYRFALYPGKDVDYSLRLYHELGIGVGFYGQGDVFTYCHAGGLGTLACTQQFPVTIIIDSLPDA